MSSRPKWQQLLRCSLQNFWMSIRLDRLSASDMLSFRHTSEESGVGMVRRGKAWIQYDSKTISLEPLVGFYQKSCDVELSEDWEWRKDQDLRKCV